VSHGRHEVFTVMKIHVVFFWVVMQCMIWYAINVSEDLAASIFNMWKWTGGVVASYEHS